MNGGGTFEAGLRSFTAPFGEVGVTTGHSANVVLLHQFVRLTSLTQEIEFVFQEGINRVIQSESRNARATEAIMRTHVETAGTFIEKIKFRTRELVGILGFGVKKIPGFLVLLAHGINCTLQPPF